MTLGSASWCTDIPIGVPTVLGRRAALVVQSSSPKAITFRQGDIHNVKTEEIVIGENARERWGRGRGEMKAQERNLQHGRGIAYYTPVLKADVGYFERANNTGK
jgi:hypothetical protein